MILLPSNFMRYNRVFGGDVDYRERGVQGNKEEGLRPSSPY